MSLRKLRCFGILATFLAFATAGEVNCDIEVQALNVLATVPSAALLPVQSKNTKVLATGKVLVASRDLADPNFAETVVLLVHYDAQNVVGLVLNRRSDVPLSRVLKGLKAAKDRSDPVYLGGPVETPAVFGLLQSQSKVDGAERVVGGVYLISEKKLFEHTISARPDPGNFHVYLGYAGWTADQLKMEVALGAWFIFQGDSSTVFSSDPDSLWSQMIRKTELKLAIDEPPADPSAITRQLASSWPLDAQTHSLARVRYLPSL
jgi:putative transcriptional regulator